MDLCVLPASNSKNRGNTPEDAWFVHSAKTLERTMDISSHVAWHMRHRFRVAMVRASREQLSGEVEVDETMIGGVDRGGKRGRGASKELVVIAVTL